MRSIPVDVDRILDLAARADLGSQAALAERAKLCAKTVWSVLKREQAALGTLNKLAVALGVSPEELLRRPSSIVKDRPGVEAKHGPVLRRIRDDKQDTKLVLKSKDMSSQLLSGNLPTFSECLRATKVFTPADDEHKDRPHLRGFAYNHFIQPSIILGLEDKRQPWVIGYTREKRPRHPGHKHTTGLSILFGASPAWNLVRQDPTPLDRWLEIADPREAYRTLLEGPVPALAAMVRYKIDLSPYQRRIEPLGVITRDEQDESCRRIYTQFVFLATLKPFKDDLEQFLRKIPMDGSSLYLLADDLSAEEEFTSYDGRLNLMDIVAWRALHSREESFLIDRAQFERGFEIA